MPVGQEAAVTVSTTDQQAARDLSVVVIAINGPRTLEECLDALVEQSRERGVEILVVMDAAKVESHRGVRERFPEVRWLDASPLSTVPQMRSLAIAQCRRDIVALLEDDCVVEPGWCDAVIEAHRGHDAAIGGAVEPGRYRRALDWAVYFCEYGRFMRPLRRQPHIALELAGSHVTYKRSMLMQALGGAGGFHDMFVHLAWHESGIPMRTEQTLVVRNVNSWVLKHVTSVPYHHGRAFAGQRFLRRPVWWRAAAGCLALALPALKVARVIRDTIACRRFTGRLVQALPWIVVFMTSWSLGEVVGSFRGPGISPSRWR